MPPKFFFQNWKKFKWTWTKNKKNYYFSIFSPFHWFPIFCTGRIPQDGSLCSQKCDCLRLKHRTPLLVLPPDTTQNNPTSIIHHLQSCHFLCFSILCATEFQGAHLPRSHVNLSAFLKHHSAYLQDNEKNRIMWCGPRLRPNFWKWPAVQKFWPPLH